MPPRKRIPQKALDQDTEIERMVQDMAPKDDKQLNAELRARLYEQTRQIAEIRHQEVSHQQVVRIRDEYLRRNVELIEENERISLDNSKAIEELKLGTSPRIRDLGYKIDLLEKNLVALREKRALLQEKYKEARNEQLVGSQSRRDEIERINNERLNLVNEVEKVEADYKTLLETTEKEESVPKAVKNYLKEMAELVGLAKDRLEQLKKKETIGAQLTKRKAELEMFIAKLQEQKLRTMKLKPAIERSS